MNTEAQMSLHLDELHPISDVGLASLRRHWKLIVAFMVSCVFIVTSFPLLIPAKYTVSTQLLIYVREVQPGPDLVVSVGRADLTQVENEIEIIRSRGTLARVVRSLNLAEDPEFSPDTTPLGRIIRWISGASSGSDENRRREDRAIETLKRHIAITRVRTSHTILVDVTTSDPNKSERIANGISQAVLQASEQDSGRSPLLRERLQGLGPNAYVMTPALAPDKPSGPRKLYFLLGAIVLGFLGGSVLALLLDFNDKTIRTAAQLEHLGFECIGAIPVLQSRKQAPAGGFRSISEWGRESDFLPDPLLHQTLLRIKASIETSGMRTVGIVSTGTGEGATTVARLFAHQMAASSQAKVLFVDADGDDALQRLAAAKSFGATAFNRHACADAGDERKDASSEFALLAPPVVDSVDSTVEPHAHDPGASLAAYDLVVVSLPPLERGAEFRMAAKKLDGILLVVRWGGPEVDRLLRALAVARAVPSDFIGTVLNMLDGRLIGQFGDELWHAQAALAAGRLRFGSALTAEPVAG